MASIVAVARDGRLNVLCSERELAIIMLSDGGAELKETDVALTFDGSVETDYPWLDLTSTEDGWVAGLYEDEVSFWPAIEALKRHRAAEVVVGESGRE